MGLKWNSNQTNLELYTWGSNQYGQLGDATNNSSSTPVRIPDPIGSYWGKIACGSDHSIALDSNGILYTWGRNNSGQLGDSTNVNKNIPTSTSSIVFNLIDGGGNSSTAVDILKNLYSWGENTAGGLGDNTLVSKKSITKNNYLSNSLEISTGYYHSLSISSDPPATTSGSTWVFASSSSPIKVGFENGQFTGSDTRMSYDGGFNWQPVAIDLTNVYSFTTPVFGGGNWVVWKHYYGLNGPTLTSAVNAYTSPDGINWSLRTSLSYKLNTGHETIGTPSNAHSVPGVQRLSFFNGKFFGFIGTRGNRTARNIIVSHSVDGDTWIQGTISGLTYVDGFNGATARADLCEVRGVANGLTVSVAVGRGLNGNLTISSIKTNKCIRSTNQTSWTVTTLPFSAVWNAIAYGNGRFVAVCDGINAATSTDGINWTSISMPSTLNWTGVAYGNGMWIAVGGPSSVAATSTDGINWTKTTLPVSAIWSSIAYGNSQFLITSSSGISLVGPNATTTTLGPGIGTTTLGPGTGTTTLGPGTGTTTLGPGTPGSPPCCPGGPTTDHETHLHSGSISWADSKSPVIWDDNVVGPYWMIEWYEVDSNNGVHAWISKRESVCLYPATNRISSVRRVGSPKGCSLSASVVGVYKPDLECNPLCTETEITMGVKAKFNYDAMKSLKGFGGMHWQNTQYLSGLNTSDFPSNGIIGPMGAGASICGNPCPYRAYGDYTAALNSLTMGLMNNQVGSMISDGNSTLKNLTGLRIRLSGGSHGGLPKINFHLSQEEKEYRSSLYPQAATNNRDSDNPCCSANDIVRASDECG
jgi:hypothetical protein